MFSAHQPRLLHLFHGCCISAFLLSTKLTRMNTYIKDPLEYHLTSVDCEREFVDRKSILVSFDPNPLRH